MEKHDVTAAIILAAGDGTRMLFGLVILDKIKSIAVANLFLAA